MDLRACFWPALGHIGPQGAKIDFAASGLAWQLVGKVHKNTAQGKYMELVLNG